MRASLTAATLLIAFVLPTAGPAGAVPAGPAPAVASPSDVVTEVRLKRHRHRRVGRGGGRFNNVTRGAPGGDSGGNAVTGSGAAPSGR